MSNKIKFVCKICRKPRAPGIDSVCWYCDIFEEFEDGITVHCGDVLEEVNDYLEENEEFERLRDKVVFEISHKHPESMAHIHLAEYIKSLSKKACDKLYRQAQHDKSTRQQRPEGYEE